MWAKQVLIGYHLGALYMEVQPMAGLNMILAHKNVSVLTKVTPHAQTPNSVD